MGNFLNVLALFKREFKSYQFSIYHKLFSDLLYLRHPHGQVVAVALEAEALIEPLRARVAGLRVDGDAADTSPHKALNQVLQECRADSSALRGGMHRQPRQMPAVKIKRTQLISDNRAVSFSDG